jgi:hypothetical protein
MISEVTACMNGQMGMNKLYSIIHPYPTRAEAVRATGDQFFTFSISGLMRGVMSSILSWSLGSVQGQSQR